jgi:hypothetical protein
LAVAEGAHVVDEPTPRHYYYPRLQLDLTYLPPAMSVSAPTLTSGSRFSVLTWDDVRKPVVDVWAAGTEAHRRILGVLAAALGSIGSDRPARRAKQLAEAGSAAPRGPAQIADGPREAAAAGLEVAAATAGDGRQRALDVGVGSLEELQEMRPTLRDALRSQPEASGLRHVRTWLWDASTSGGQPLTHQGWEPDTSCVSPGIASQSAEVGHAP